jgi:hypothetical protein
VSGVSNACAKDVGKKLRSDAEASCAQCPLCLVGEQRPACTHSEWRGPLEAASNSAGVCAHYSPWSAAGGAVLIGA